MEIHLLTHYCYNVNVTFFLGMYIFLITKCIISQLTVYVYLPIFSVKITDIIPFK